MKEDKKIENPFVGACVTETYLQEVITLRDYFAGKSMQAQLTALWAMKEWHGWNSDAISKEAYSIADEMLKQRSLND